MNDAAPQDPGYDALDRELNRRMQRIDRLAETFGSEWADEETARLLDEIALRRKPTDTSNALTRFAALAGACLLALSLGGASAADYTPTAPTAPIGCAITHYWEQDDMSAIAVCAGGYLVTKQDGPVDDWDDIPYAIDTLVLTDAQGGRHDWAVLD